MQRRHFTIIKIKSTNLDLHDFPIRTAEEYNTVKVTLVEWQYRSSVIEVK